LVVPTASHHHLPPPSRVRLVSVTHNLPARVQIHIHRATANSTIHSNSNILPILTDSRRSLLSHHLCILNPPIHLKGTLTDNRLPHQYRISPYRYLSNSHQQYHQPSYGGSLAPPSVHSRARSLASAPYATGAVPQRADDFPDPNLEALTRSGLTPAQAYQAQVYRNNPAGQPIGSEWSRRPTGSPQTGEFARAANGNTISGRRAHTGSQSDGGDGG